MSRRPSFANLRGAPAPAPAPASAPPARAEVSAPAAGDEGKPTPTRAASREGRKQIAGFFPPQMSLALHMLALRQDRSLQSLMAEAFNDVLRKHGESPVGE